MKVKIELTASPVLLDALLAIAQAFGGRAVTSTLEVTEKAPRTSRSTKAMETTKPLVVEKTEPVVEKVEEKVTEKVETVVEKVEKIETSSEETTITVETLRALVRDKAQAGKREGLKAVLAEMGSANVTTLKEDQYAEFKAKVEAL